LHHTALLIKKFSLSLPAVYSIYCDIHLLQIQIHCLRCNCTAVNPLLLHTVNAKLNSILTYLLTYLLTYSMEQGYS